MGEAFRYWQWVRIDSAGNRRIESIPVARSFFEHQFPDSADLTDAAIQRQLFRILHESKNHHDLAELCLRGFISYQTDWICRDLVNQFGQKAGFTWIDLYVHVFDDLRSTHRQKNSEYRSVADKILETFDPDQGQLSTWTNRLVKAELGAILLSEWGIYLSSDWALLNGMKPESWQRICDRTLRLPTWRTTQMVQILTAYHRIYRRDRQQKQGNQSRRKCTPPNSEQLAEMQQVLTTQGVHFDSTRQLLEELEAIAQLIRQLRCPAQTSIDTPEGQSWVDHPKNTALVGQSPIDVAEESETAQAQAQWLTQYRHDLLICLEQSFANVVSQQLEQVKQTKPTKVEVFLPALFLFHCECFAMGKIAKLLNLGTQSTVSRLLKLDQLRTNLRHTLLLKLRDRIRSLAPIYLDRSQLETFDQQIDAILSEQIDPIICEAEIEASTPNRACNSLFFRSLCRHLATRSISL